MKKDRLTERDKYGHAYFPECFKEPCLGSGCAKEPCELMKKSAKSLQSTRTQDGFQLQKDFQKSTIPYSQNIKGHQIGSQECLKRLSEYVLVTIKYKDGDVLVDRARTVDGGWKTETSFLGRKIIAWMPFPEPYKED